MHIFLRRLPYALEAVLIVLPSSLFLLASFPWLFAGPSLKAWWPSLVVLFLWVGGVIGVITLWQMFAHLWFGKPSKIRFLLLRLIIGTAAAATPVVFVYNSPPETGKRTPFLLFLCPVVVGAHWAWGLRRRNAHLSTQSE